MSSLRSCSRHTAAARRRLTQYLPQQQQFTTTTTAAATRATRWLTCTTATATTTQRLQSQTPRCLTATPHFVSSFGRHYTTTTDVTDTASDATSPETARPVSYAMDMLEFWEPNQSEYAVVKHGDAYHREIQGLHGKTLAKAAYEGKYKDDAPFDPFAEDERMEQELMDEYDDDNEDDYDEEDEDDDLEFEKEDARTKKGDVVISGKKNNDYDDDEEDEDDDDFDDEEDDLDLDLDPQAQHEQRALTMYNNDGSIRRKKSQKATLRAGAAAGGMFAVVALAGSQHKVTTDDLLIVNRLDVEEFKVGSIHALSDVLLLGTSHYTLVGLPYVPHAAVHVMVEEITKGHKVIIFKKRRRKHSQRKTGFRRDVTMLRILDITPPEEYQDWDYVPRLEPDLLKPRWDPRWKFEQEELAKNQPDRDDEEEEDDQGAGAA